MTSIEHRHLRSALEFAVLIAAEGQKRRPPLDFPKELKPYLSRPRLPSGALGRVRRAIESNSGFRAAIAAGALPELVDEVGRLWLGNGPEWEIRADAVIRDRRDEAEAKNLQRDLTRAEKRRTAAEKVAARNRVELVALEAELDARRAEIDDLRADVLKATDAITELRAELVDTRNEARHARDREAAAVERAEAAIEQAPTEHAERAGPGEPAIDDERLERRELDDVVAAAYEVVARLDELRHHGPRRDAEPDDVGLRSSRGSPRPVRRPLALPGGVISTSAEAAGHLVRSDALVLVDGYNVAMLAWPERNLEEQRDALVARVENLARRHGTDVTIVFDGSSIVGAHTRRRRLVRVTYSPEGVTADDVIRSELDRVPVTRAVVVVTNDREIIDDVRRVGANVVASNAFIAVL